MILDQFTLDTSIDLHIVNCYAQLSTILQFKR